jgi:hypothetical protein
MLSRVQHITLSCICLLVFVSVAIAQSPGGSGSVAGVVTDPSGASVVAATVELRNPRTRYTRTAVTDDSGAFRFIGVPPNPYHLEATFRGFPAASQDISVRSSVPVSVDLRLALPAVASTVTVDARDGHLLENVPYAHNDLDHSVFSQLPAVSPAAGLSDVITLGSPGVAADSNGFFHPLGDHAQTTFAIDGQPVSDQQSKQFSTQIPLNALQSIEMITGSQPAEFGDKTSLVVNAQTKSGLGQKTFGSFIAQYGSFGTVSEEASLGSGNAKFGNFLVVNTLRSGRFLDTPEFRPIHAIGNNGTVFDRIDVQPGPKDAFHVNLFLARNWFQVPNTYDQPQQDQRQRVLTWNVAPAYQHIFSAHTVLNVTSFMRQDQVNYYPSRLVTADVPATVGEGRRLLNYGTKTDVSYASGRHNVKIGTQLMQTRLKERFDLGITDPAFNPVCIDANGVPQLLSGVSDPSGCVALGYTQNPDLQPGLVPFDLSRGGAPFDFAGTANINEYAFYAQDSMTFGGLNVSAGLRVDRYNGLSSATGVQPRLGASYQLPGNRTIVRASFARTFETPYNENLILSSSTGAGGLATNVFGGFPSRPIRPGRRNQLNAGVEHAFGKFLVVDGDYFWKFTDNAFDFAALLNTPIQFPISWRKSKIDGVAVRVSTPDLHGFRLLTTMGHTRARFFGPSNGGLLFNSPLDNSVFRIDHDQAFQQTTYLRYQRPTNGPWAAFTWRYDSGLVAGAVPDLDAALALTPAQQAAIGFFCDERQATISSPVTSCSGSDYGAVRLRIPAPGTASPDHNPPRVAPRHVFDVGLGTDNLFHAERYRTVARFTVANLANKAALYNFLSTFSGTHFIAPRAYRAEIGVAF